jgi:hypothetical protein
MATTRNFVVMSDKFNVDKICSLYFLTSSSKKENDAGYNTGDDNGNNNNVTWLSDDR